MAGTCSAPLFGTDATVSHASRRFFGLRGRSLFHIRHWCKVDDNTRLLTLTLTLTKDSSNLCRATTNSHPRWDSQLHLKHDLHRIFFALERVSHARCYVLRIAASPLIQVSRCELGQSDRRVLSARVASTMTPLDPLATSLTLLVATGPHLQVIRNIGTRKRRKRTITTRRRGQRALSCDSSAEIPRCCFIDPTPSRW